MKRSGLSSVPWLWALALVWAPLTARAAPLNTRVGPFEMQVLVNGTVAPTYFHQGESYVLGQKGERYTLRVYNHSGRRVEAVVTVDGLDVLDGKAGSTGKRGYLVPAWGSVDIDGWRLSRADVAAFRFSGVASSYAGQTGRTRDVGVIGVAIFKERVYAPPPPVHVTYPYPRHYPYPSDPYSDRESGKTRRGAGDSADRATSEAPPPARSAAAAGSGTVARPTRPREERPGLATAFGERTYSPVQHTTFQRANSRYPNGVLGARYNDQPGLVALGVDLSYPGCCYNEPDLRRSATPFPATDPRYSEPPPGWVY